MSQIVVPVIVVEGRDLSLWGSVAAAEQQLEPVDVKNGEYIVYDAEGHLLELTVESDKEGSLAGVLMPVVERVCIRAPEVARSNAAELRRSLVEFLTCLSPRNAAEIESLSLPSLVRRAVGLSRHSEP